MVRQVAAVVVGSWLSAGPALAICPHPTPKACSAFFESDVVFVGTVLSRRYSSDNEYLRFGVRVARVLRGSVGQTTVVYTGNDSGRLMWEVGKQYVVFARRERGRLLSGDDCGPLSDPAKVAETIRQIEPLRRVTAASIEGEVLSSQPDGAGVPGVLVRVRGGGKTFEVKSDARGALQLQVPPGHYQVLLDPSLRQSDYNLGTNLSEIVLVPGQCAQVQLVVQ